MFVLSYRIHDYDGGEFEILFCSSDKSLIEAKQVELTEKYLVEQREFHKGLEELRKQFPTINSDMDKEKYNKVRESLPKAGRYIIRDPEMDRRSQGPAGEFIIDEVEEL